MPILLSIPDIHKQGFKYFIKLKDNKRVELIKEIENAPIGLSPIKLAQQISGKLNLEKSKLDAIIPLIFSLFSARQSLGIDVDSFTDGIIEALERTGDEKLKTTKNFRKQLIQLLSIKGSFYFSFKAYNLSAEREKLLTNTNILTDIRPVFGDEQDFNIKCSVIIHNLKIEFFEHNNEHREVYLALDSEDLKKLKDNIIRAEEKEKAIREQFKKTNISFLDIK
ncbi:MAG: hypothetical protein ACE5HI_10220 [bacterium]